MESTVCSRNGHSFQDGLCIGCGALHPLSSNYTSPTTRPQAAEAQDFIGPARMQESKDEQCGPQPAVETSRIGLHKTRVEEDAGQSAAQEGSTPSPVETPDPIMGDNEKIRLYYQPLLELTENENCDLRRELGRLKTELEYQKRIYEWLRQDYLRAIQ